MKDIDKSDISNIFEKESLQILSHIKAIRKMIKIDRINFFRALYIN